MKCGEKGISKSRLNALIFQHHRWHYKIIDTENMHSQETQASTSSGTTQLVATLGIHCSWVLVAVGNGSYPMLLCEGTAASRSPGGGGLAVRRAGGSQAAVGYADG